MSGMTQLSRDETGGRVGLIVVTCALMALGLVMVGSTSASLDRPLFATDMWRTVFGRQVVFVGVGVCVLLATARLAPPLLRSPGFSRWGPRVLFTATLVLLVVALVPGLGSAQRGSSRWLRFDVGGFEVGFQPSEIAKLSMVAMLASMLTATGADPRSLKRLFLPAALVVAVTVSLVGKEDFGTAGLLAVVGGSMLLVGGCRRRHLAVLVVLGVVGLAWLVNREPYRMARMTAFLHPEEAAAGAGYQPLQSLMTIASGGWFGAGLGSGMQKYGYLPECRTDFIFAVICEELGALGAGLVILLFVTLIVLGMRTMVGAASRFERLLSFGLIATIGLQATMNIAVVTVTVPTTGISMPLISAGGSGLIMVCFSIGLLIAARGGDRPGQWVQRSTTSARHRGDGAQEMALC